MHVTESNPIEGMDVAHRARLVDYDNVVLVDTDFNGGGTYDLNVYDDEGVSVYSVSSGALPGTLVQTALVTNDGGWTKDSKGYTFKNVLTTGNVAMEGGRTYTSVYDLTSDSKGNIRVVFVDRCRSVGPG